MGQTRYLAAAALAAALLAGPAHAQTSASPQQIQSLIASGQADQAIDDLQPVLQAHPHSGVAWYLTAEAQDALGNEPAARNALAKAEQYAPGLPFAKSSDVAALQAHLNSNAADRPRHGFGGALWVIGGLALLFILLRVFLRRRMIYRGGYGPGGFPAARPPVNPYPYGPGGMGYGQSYGPGGGIGNTLLGGLAAGAGFAAGERVIDDLTGPRMDERPFDQNQPQAIDPDAVPDRDDGLIGSPGWDNGDPGQDDNNNFDPNNSW